MSPERTTAAADLARVEKVAVIGGGVMGRGCAQVFAR
jgi:hypothetical protein